MVPMKVREPMAQTSGCVRFGMSVYHRYGAAGESTYGAVPLVFLEPTGGEATPVTQVTHLTQLSQTLLLQLSYYAHWKEQGGFVNPHTVQNLSVLLEHQLEQLRVLDATSYTRVREMQSQVTKLEQEERRLIRMERKGGRKNRLQEGQEKLLEARQEFFRTLTESAQTAPPPVYRHFHPISVLPALLPQKRNKRKPDTWVKKILPMQLEAKREREHLLQSLSQSSGTKQRELLGRLQTMGWIAAPMLPSAPPSNAAGTVVERSLDTLRYRVAESKAQEYEALRADLPTVLPPALVKRWQEATQKNQRAEWIPLLRDLSSTQQATLQRMIESVVQAETRAGAAGRTPVVARRQDNSPRRDVAEVGEEKETTEQTVRVQRTQRTQNGKKEDERRDVDQYVSAGLRQSVNTNANEQPAQSEDGVDTHAEAPVPDGIDPIGRDKRNNPLIGNQADGQQQTELDEHIEVLLPDEDAQERAIFLQHWIETSDSASYQLFLQRMKQQTELDDTSRETFLRVLDRGAEIEKQTLLRLLERTSETVIPDRVSVPNRVPRQTDVRYAAEKISPSQREIRLLGWKTEEADRQFPFQPLVLRMGERQAGVETHLEQKLRRLGIEQENGEATLEKWWNKQMRHAEQVKAEPAPKAEGLPLSARQNPVKGAVTHTASPMQAKTDRILTDVWETVSHHQENPAVMERLRVMHIQKPQHWRDNARELSGRQMPWSELKPPAHPSQVLTLLKQVRRQEVQQLTVTEATERLQKTLEQETKLREWQQAERIRLETLLTGKSEKTLAPATLQKGKQQRKRELEGTKQKSIASLRTRRESEQTSREKTVLERVIIPYGGQVQTPLRKGQTAFHVQDSVEKISPSVVLQNDLREWRQLRLLRQEAERTQRNESARRETEYAPAVLRPTFTALGHTIPLPELRLLWENAGIPVPDTGREEIERQLTGQPLHLLYRILPQALGQVKPLAVQSGGLYPTERSARRLLDGVRISASYRKGRPAHVGVRPKQDTTPQMGFSAQDMETAARVFRLSSPAALAQASQRTPDEPANGSRLPGRTVRGGPVGNASETAAESMTQDDKNRIQTTSQMAQPRITAPQMGFSARDMETAERVFRISSPAVLAQASQLTPDEPVNGSQSPERTVRGGHVGNAAETAAESMAQDDKNRIQTTSQMAQPRITAPQMDFSARDMETAERVFRISPPAVLAQVSQLTPDEPENGSRSPARTVRGAPVGNAAETAAGSMERDEQNGLLKMTQIKQFQTVSIETGGEAVFSKGTDAPWRSQDGQHPAQKDTLFHYEQAILLYITAPQQELRLTGHPAAERVAIAPTLLSQKTEIPPYESLKPPQRKPMTATLHPRTLQQTMQMLQLYYQVSPTVLASVQQSLVHEPRGQSGKSQSKESRRNERVRPLGAVDGAISGSNVSARPALSESGGTRSIDGGGTSFVYRNDQTLAERPAQLLDIATEQMLRKWVEKSQTARGRPTQDVPLLLDAHTVVKETEPTVTVLSARQPGELPRRILVELRRRSARSVTQYVPLQLERKRALRQLRETAEMLDLETHPEAAGLELRKDAEGISFAYVPQTKNSPSGGQAPALPEILQVRDSTPSGQATDTRNIERPAAPLLYAVSQHTESQPIEQRTEQTQTSPQTDIQFLRKETTAQSKVQQETLSELEKKLKQQEVLVQRLAEEQKKSPEPEKCRQEIQEITEQVMRSMERELRLERQRRGL